eukprot:m.72153 g.72153  ORF g.72153 m.72153 type:complete len:1965 (-) comp12306_c0_seq2:340-6234(-)
MPTLVQMYYQLEGLLMMVEELEENSPHKPDEFVKAKENNILQKTNDRIDMVNIRNLSRERAIATRVGMWGRALPPMIHVRKRVENLSFRVSEHYLRKDITCRFLACRVCDNLNLDESTKIPRDAKRVVIPDVETCQHFLEVFENGGLSLTQGIVFADTIVRYFRQTERLRRFNLDRKIRALSKESVRGCIVFPNEFFEETFVERSKGTSIEEHRTKLINQLAAWYGAHLHGQVPVIVLVANKASVASNTKLEKNVTHMDLQDYLHTYHSEDTESLNLLQSLISMRQQNDEESNNILKLGKNIENVKRDDTTGYVEYLPRATLISGIHSGQFVKGVLRVNKFCAMEEAFVTIGNQQIQQKMSSKEIAILGFENRNRAIEGDLVVVEVQPEKQWVKDKHPIKESDSDLRDNLEDTEQLTIHGNAIPVGRVVGVLENKGWRSFVVTLFAEDLKSPGTKVLGVPFDKRVPKIRFTTANKDSIMGKRLVVRIDNWPLNSKWPQGHFVKTLGNVGDIDVETQSILLERSVSCDKFSPQQLSELPKPTPEKPWVVDAKEVAQRRDIRKTHLVYSIDPLGCEDVDDALCVQKLPNGNFELSVHIADVSHFIKTGSINDQEAAKRGTTVYMCDRRFDMIPAVLSTDICSLLADVDRYAVSVFWELDDNLQIQNTWFGRTVIRSSYKLHYEFAQDVADGLPTNDIISSLDTLRALPKNEGIRKADTLRASIKLLMGVARGLRARRRGLGGLELSGNEIRVKLGQDRKTVEDLIEKTGLEIHETIEECMVFANASVAKRLTDVYPKASLLRRHPPAKATNLEELKNSSRAKGFEIDTSSNFTLAQSLNAAVDPDDHDFNRMLRMMATRYMEQAVYFSTGSVEPENWFHYGLGLTHYTHFTSPIRRYADVLVHRLLLNSLTLKPNHADQHGVISEVSTAPVFAGPSLDNVADHINNRNNAAKIVQRESLDIFLSSYFSATANGGMEVEGVVTRLQTKKVTIFVPRFGFSSTLPLHDREGHVLFPADRLEKNGIDKNELTNGHVEVTEYMLTVSLPQGLKFTIKQFDHVTVSVTARDAKYRLGDLELRLESLDISPKSGVPSGKEWMKEVKIQKQKDEVSMDTSKHHSRSKVYETLEHWKQEALLINLPTSKITFKMPLDKLDNFVFWAINSALKTALRSENPFQLGRAEFECPPDLLKQLVDELTPASDTLESEEEFFHDICNSLMQASNQISKIELGGSRAKNTCLSSKFEMADFDVQVVVALSPLEGYASNVWLNDFTWHGIPRAAVLDEHGTLTKFKNVSVQDLDPVGLKRSAFSSFNISVGSGKRAKMDVTFALDIQPDELVLLGYQNFFHYTTEAHTTKNVVAYLDSKPPSLRQTIRILKFYSKKLKKMLKSPNKLLGSNFLELVVIAWWQQQKPTDHDNLSHCASGAIQFLADVLKGKKKIFWSDDGTEFHGYWAGNKALTDAICQLWDTYPIVVLNPSHPCENVAEKTIRSLQQLDRHFGTSLAQTHGNHPPSKGTLTQTRTNILNSMDWDQQDRVKTTSVTDERMVRAQQKRGSKVKYGTQPEQMMNAQGTGLEVASFNDPPDGSGDRVVTSVLTAAQTVSLHDQRNVRCRLGLAEYRETDDEAKKSVAVMSSFVGVLLDWYGNKAYNLSWNLFMGTLNFALDHCVEDEWIFLDLNHIHLLSIIADQELQQKHTVPNRILSWLLIEANFDECPIARQTAMVHLGRENYYRFVRVVLKQIEKICYEGEDEDEEDEGEEEGAKSNAGGTLRRDIVIVVSVLRELLLFHHHKFKDQDSAYGFIQKLRDRLSEMELKNNYGCFVDGHLDLVPSFGQRMLPMPRAYPPEFPHFLHPVIEKLFELLGSNKFFWQKITPDDNYLYDACELMDIYKKNCTDDNGGGDDGRRGFAEKNESADDDDVVIETMMNIMMSSDNDDAGEVEEKEEEDDDEEDDDDDEEDNEIEDDDNNSDN